jgi:hypothetical protein
MFCLGKTALKISLFVEIAYNIFEIFFSNNFAYIFNDKYIFQNHNSLSITILLRLFLLNSCKILNICFIIVTQVIL